MIHAEVHFPSPTLGMRVSMTVLLPERGTGPFATLYLLHGLSDDHTIWSRLTRIEQYAWCWPLAIVMPQGFRGFYTDHVQGPAYAQYILNDVIGTAERMFPLRKDRDGRCIGGLSMGGYGALRVALAAPERFASAHSHSGCLMFGTLGRSKDSALSQAEHEAIFGRAPAGSSHDVVHLAQQAFASGKPVPQLAIDCGLDDFLLDQNRACHAEFTRLKIPHRYAEFPGEHNWAYWDRHIAEAIEFHAQAMRLTPAE